MSALLVRPSPQPCNNVMHNIEFQPVCEFEPAFALKHNRAYSQELFAQRAFTKRHRDVQRKSFINKCTQTQTVGQEPVETLTHEKKTPKNSQIKNILDVYSTLKC